MPKTDAEHRIVNGWSKELEKVEIERFLALFSDELLINVSRLANKRVEWDQNV